VLPRDAVTALLRHKWAVERPLAADKPDRSIDGAVVDSLSGRRPEGVKGWLEFCHNPSLVQHTGDDSTLKPGQSLRPAPSFPGEDFNCLDLLEKR
jgi:hypothetical protein